MVVKSDYTVEKVEVTTLPENYYRSIGMPKPVKKIHVLNCGEKIIQHYTHSYDKTGAVIVVPGDMEDLSKSIPQFQDQVGAKNIIRLIEGGAAPDILFSNREAAFYGDYRNMDFHGVNEVAEVLPEAKSDAEKALADFNKKYGTSLDMNTFIKLYNANLLKDHIDGLSKQKEEENGGDN